MPLYAPYHAAFAATPSQPPVPTYLPPASMAAAYMNSYTTPQYNAMPPYTGIYSTPPPAPGYVPYVQQQQQQLQQQQQQQQQQQLQQQQLQQQQQQQLQQQQFYLQYFPAANLVPRRRATTSLYT